MAAGCCLFLFVLFVLFVLLLLPLLLLLLLLLPAAATVRARVRAHVHVPVGREGRDAWKPLPADTGAWKDVETGAAHALGATARLVVREICPSPRDDDTTPAETTPRRTLMSFFIHVLNSALCTRKSAVSDALFVCGGSTCKSNPRTQNSAALPGRISQGMYELGESPEVFGRKIENVARASE